VKSSLSHNVCSSYSYRDLQVWASYRYLVVVSKVSYLYRWIMDHGSRIIDVSKLSKFVDLLETIRSFFCFHLLPDFKRIGKYVSRRALSYSQKQTKSVNLGTAIPRAMDLWPTYSTVAHGWISQRFFFSQDQDRTSSGSFELPLWIRIPTWFTVCMMLVPWGARIIQLQLRRGAYDTTEFVVSLDFHQGLSYIDYDT
jgi:hypothetical protein